MAGNPVDRHVGEQLKRRRVLLGMTQHELGDALGLTFQQVQKYEKGANRMGASRLFDAASVLGVSIEYFFLDMPTDVASRSPASEKTVLPANEVPADAVADNVMAQRETLELVRYYYRIKNKTIRKRLLAMTRAMAAQDEDGAP